jgi:hypothetical protein
VRGVAGGQVVKHADPVTARHQAPDQRRANETGPAGHQDFFGSTHKSGSLAGDGGGRRRVGDSRDGPNGANCTKEYTSIADLEMTVFGSSR